MKNRKNSLTLGAILCVSVIAILLVVRARFPAEPSYKGKPVSYWMMQTRAQELEYNEGLSAIGTNAIPYLVSALRTRQGSFGKLLEKIGTKPSPWVRRLLPHFPTKSEISLLHIRAITSLNAFSFEATPALPALYEALKDKDSEARGYALNAISKIGPTKEAIPRLIAAWDNTNRLGSGFRVSILGNLELAGRLNPEAVVSFFIRALDDESSQVRHRAALALGRIGHPAPGAVPKMIAMLKDKDCADAAAYALGCISEPVESVIPELRRLLQEKKPSVKASAALTLWQFTRESTPALQVLSEVLETHKMQRPFVASSLGKMGPAVQEAVPTLLRVAQSQDTYSHASYHRVCAAEAALRIDPSASQATDVLKESLNDPEPWIRREAAMSLGSLGAVGQAAVPALEKALQDTNREVRHYAAVALQKIKTETEKDATSR